MGGKKKREKMGLRNVRGQSQRTFTCFPTECECIMDVHTGQAVRQTDRRQKRGFNGGVCKSLPLLQREDKKKKKIFFRFPVLTPHTLSLFL